MLRVCIVGSGAFARVHAAWWRKQPGARLVAVAGRDPGRLASDLVWAGLIHLTYEQSLAAGQPYDLVDIVTPPALHAPQACRALQAGYHVLVEKPMAVSSAEGTHMINVAREMSRRLFVVSQYRFVPAYRVVGAKTRKGPFTRARFVYTMTPEAAGLVPGSWKADRALVGGGILWSSGVHLVDLLLHWFGEPDVVEGSAECALPGIDVESRYEAHWTGREGCRVEIASWAQTDAVHETTLKLERVNTQATVWNWRLQPGAPLGWKICELARGAYEKVLPWRRDPLGRQFADIVRALATNTRAEVEPEDGLSAVRMLERIGAGGVIL